MKNLLLLFLSVQLLAIEPLPLDKTREYLDKLKEKSEVKEDEYNYPFLTVQTAHVFEMGAGQVAKKLQKKLLENKTESTTPDIPTTFTQKAQLEAIEECTVKKCNIKLLQTDEAKKIEESAKAARVVLYKQMIANRITAYAKTGKLVGYEQRENNEGAIVDMARGSEFIKFKYPGLSSFIINAGWRSRELFKGGIKNSFLTNETVVIAPDKLQPIWRIGEIFEFVENGTHLFFHLHIYTNHYFDSSITLYEVIPQKEKSIFIVTDILEVDELKKSGFIRALFKGKMVDAVSLSQDNFILLLK